MTLGFKAPLAPPPVVSGALRWEADVSGYVPTRVEFFIDEKLVATERHAPYVAFGDTATWDTATVANGLHELRMVASKPDGGIEIATTLVNVQNAAPVPVPTANEWHLAMFEYSSGDVTYYDQRAKRTVRAVWEWTAAQIDRWRADEEAVAARFFQQNGGKMRLVITRFPLKLTKLDGTWKKSDTDVRSFLRFSDIDAMGHLDTHAPIGRFDAVAAVFPTQVQELKADGTRVPFTIGNGSLAGLTGGPSPYYNGGAGTTMVGTSWDLFSHEVIGHGYGFHLKNNRRPVIHVDHGDWYFGSDRTKWPTENLNDLYVAGKFPRAVMAVEAGWEGPGFDPDGWTLDTPRT